MTLLPQSTYVQRINRFLYTPAYFYVVAGLTILANLCGLELFTYSCFILIGLYLCLLGPDLLPIIPLVICSYIAPSRSNNPGKNAASIFSFEKGGLYLIILAVIFVAALTYRLIRDPEIGGKAFFTCKRKLLPGILVLGGAYLLSGLGSDQWTLVGWWNLLFAFLQFASIFLLYYIFTAAVKWDSAPKAYLAWTGVCVGYVLVVELAFIFLRYNVIRNGEIFRYAIYTGWGHYNNIGALLTMMIPFTFFLTGKGRYSGIFYLTGMLFLAAILFTCSRNSILCAVVIYTLSYTISLINSRRARANLVIHIFTVLLVICVYILFKDTLLRLFHDLIEMGTDSSNRDKVFSAAIQQFFRHPIFGGTFYPEAYPIDGWSTSEAFVAFFPNRWHNTVLQLLASCGVVGLGAYLYHRWQTLMLFLRRPSGKKMFVFVYMLALMGTSMLDCHMFNVGPVLMYSMALAFVEKKLNQ